MGFGVRNPVCCSFCGKPATGCIEAYDICDSEECFNRATK